MIWLLYNVLFVVGFLLMTPRFLVRMRRRGGYAGHFGERFGLYDAGVLAKVKDGGRIWVHAVSVGEIFVALRFISELRSRRPDARFVLSTTTSTGRAIAEKNLDARDVLVYFPVDFPPFVRRALNTIRPRALVLVECELWPNLIRLAKRRGVPVVLVNGRISEHSYRGYSKLRLFTRPLLQYADLLCVQSEADRDRLVNLGAPADRVRLMGSAKYDLAPEDGDGAEKARAALRAAGVGEGDVILLGGSTWEGEESALLETYAALKPAFPNLVLVLVPRHAERSDSVEQAVKARGVELVRRTALRDGAEAGRKPDVVLVDTTGELRRFYACADVIFVGKSLTQRGGQNIIEPALYGKAIIVGPHLENFTVIQRDFEAAQAMVQVPDAAALTRAVEDLLRDPARRAALGERALRLVREKVGAVAKTVDLVLPLLP